jgi:hypothetical protein
MDAQDVSLRALATMDEFGAALTKIDSNLDENANHVVENDEEVETYDTKTNDSTVQPSDMVVENDEEVETYDTETNDSTIQPSDMVVALFDDGYYPGEVISVSQNEIKILFMKLKIFTLLTGGDTGRRFWYWPSLETNKPEIVPKSAILPVFPNLSMNTKFTSNRTFVLELLNADIIDKMV